MIARNFGCSITISKQEIPQVVVTKTRLEAQALLSANIMVAGRDMLAPLKPFTTDCILRVYLEAQFHLLLSGCS